MTNPVWGHLAGVVTIVVMLAFTFLYLRVTKGVEETE